MRASSGASSSDVVFTFSYETLDDAVGREFCRPAEQTLLALARDARVGELLVADPWRSYLLSAARHRSVRLAERMAFGGRDVVWVRPHRMRRSDATDLGRVELSYQRYGALLGRALAWARGMSHAAPASACLVTYHPFVAAFCDAPWISKMVYFAQDDFASYEPIRRWRNIFHAAYRRIEERGAEIFAVSDELAGRLSPRASVVPNGVIAEVWRPDYPAPPRIAALPTPRAIYTGTLDDRLDMELVQITASTVGSLIMMGYPNDALTVRQLNSLENVHIFDAVGQRELAATVQGCDVGVIPHRDLELTRAMSPLKLYEYLAAGLPVVSADLPPVHGVDDERVIVCGRESWAASLLEAIGMGKASDTRRQRFIDDVSWERRAYPVVESAIT
jgi:teichuronic acid biosynthesis glycosyltransferase TuaH